MFALLTGRFTNSRSLQHTSRQPAPNSEPESLLTQTSAGAVSLSFTARFARGRRGRGRQAPAAARPASARVVAVPEVRALGLPGQPRGARSFPAGFAFSRVFPEAPVCRLIEG